MTPTSEASARSVWRVEWPNGDGPYCQELYDHWEQSDFPLIDVRKHPAPPRHWHYAWVARNISRFDVIYGCHDRDELAAWWKGWGDALSELGLVVREYAATVLGETPAQLIFDRSTAAQVATHDPADVL